MFTIENLESMLSGNSYEEVLREFSEQLTKANERIAARNAQAQKMAAAENIAKQMNEFMAAFYPELKAEKLTGKDFVEIAEEIAKMHKNVISPLEKFLQENKLL